MKKLLLLIALPLAVFAESQTATQTERDAEFALKILSESPEVTNAVETNIVVIPAPGQMRGWRYVCDAFDRQNSDLSFVLPIEMLCEITRYSFCEGDSRQYRGECSPALVGPFCWNRKVIGLVEQEIVRRAIPQSIVDRYIAFKDSGFMQRIERQALQEFGFNDVRTAEEADKAYDITGRMFIILAAEHAEKTRELIRLLSDIYPILIKRIHALRNGDVTTEPAPALQEVTPTTR
jgi:hypothetical protein